MKRSVLVVSVAVVMALFAAACSEAPEVKPSNSAGASAAGAIALVQAKTEGGQLTYTSVRFVDRVGKEIRTFMLPAGATSPTVGGDRVFFVVDGEVHSVGTAGPSTNHGRSMETGGSFYDIVVSPDGKRWAWREDDVGLGRATFDSRVFVAGIGQEKKLLIEQEGKDRVLTPMLWSDAGLVVVDMEVGIGGLVFYPDSYWNISRLVDPDSGAVQPLTALPDRCILNDVAADGSWTCVEGLDGGGSAGSPAEVTVKLHRAGGGVTNLSVDRKALQAGGALISRGGDRIAVGIFTGPTTGDAYHLDTITFDVASGKQRVVTSDGSQPVAWLPDGALVLAIDQPVGPAKVSLLTADGERFALGDGEFVGYVSTSGSIPSH